jgi:hypothetical protein
MVGEACEVLEDERRPFIVQRETVARRPGRGPAQRGLAAGGDQALDVVPRTGVGAVQAQTVAPREA